MPFHAIDNVTNWWWGNRRKISIINKLNGMEGRRRMGSEHISANVNTWNFSLIFRRWLSTFAKKKMQNYFVWAHALSLSSAHSLTIYSFSSISFDALNENYGIRCVQDWWHGCFAAVRLLTFLCCWCFFFALLGCRSSSVNRNSLLSFFSLLVNVCGVDSAIYSMCCCCCFC